MAAKNLTNLLSQIRREIRDETEATYVFTTTELTDYITNAIRAYSQVIPREIKSTLSLTTDEDEYSLPEDCREIVSIKVGTTEYSVIDVFGGLMTVSPTPTADATATFKYRGMHTIPTALAASTYDPIDEPLIVKHVRAQCWETLAGDGARYYRYTEGDIEEDQGKTQEQFRKEANALFAEFDAGVQASAEALLARRPVANNVTIAGVISRTKPSRSTTIFREFES
jgi:hypothetical protein